MTQPPKRMHRLDPLNRRNRLHRRALLAGAILLGAGIPLLPGCGGRETENTKTTLLPPMTFARSWRTDLHFHREHATELHMRGDMLISYASNGTAYLLRRNDGLLLHSDTVPGGDFRLRPPVVLGDRIIYPTTTMMEVFDTGGKHIRSINLGGAIRSRAVGERSFLYVGTDTGTGAGRISKFDLNAGSDTPVWQLQTYHGGIEAAPAVQSNIVFAASNDGLVYAVSADSRAPVWPLVSQNTPDYVFNARAPVVADLVADETGLFVCTLDGRMYCLNLLSGQIKWQYFGGGPLENPPVLSVDSVYLLDPKHGLVAMDKVNPAPSAYNRTPRWSIKDAAQFLAQDDRNVFLRRQDNTIVAVDKSTGTEQFRAKRKDLRVFANNRRDGVVYAATSEGVIVSIRAVYDAGTMGVFVMAPADPHLLAGETLADAR